MVTTKKKKYIPKFLIIRNVPTKIIRDVHFHFFLKCQNITLYNMRMILQEIYLRSE